MAVAFYNAIFDFEHKLHESNKNTEDKENLTLPNDQSPEEGSPSRPLIDEENEGSGNPKMEADLEISQVCLHIFYSFVICVTLEKSHRSYLYQTLLLKQELGNHRF